MHGKRSKLTAILAGVIISVGVVYLGFTLVSGYFTRASDERPEDVTILNITETSARVTWSTANENEGGVIQYGVSPASLTSYAPAEGGRTKSHSVDLTLLAPATTYYFEIFYGEGRKFDNAGVPWTFVTKERKANIEASGSAQTIPPVVQPIASPTTIIAPTSPAILSCTDTDCDAIKAKLGRGCSTQEYIRCIKREATVNP
ncbi:fibronectin type III domain-containing protein [Candidatus Microgenomates bacterium]|nr:fibronectin type III domain-containing protein [Candidatus Microgenomates bacterium]